MTRSANTSELARPGGAAAIAVAAAIAALAALAGCRGCEGAVADWLEDEARPLAEVDDLEPLLRRAEGRDLILLGEATHGTREFYTWRREATQALVRRGAIGFIAVEGDWPLLLDINAWVRGEGPRGGDDGAARDLVAGLDRWPAWMWANEEFLDLVRWLRAWNADRPPEDRVGIYGVDIYSPERGARDVVAWADARGADADEHACLREVGGPDGADYRRRVQGARGACEGEIEALIAELDEAARAGEDEAFYLATTARTVRQAARHFEADGDDAWNARASHFYDVASRLLAREGEGGAGVVWAHNTHIGDGEATPMADRGRVNLGLLAREELGRGAVFRVGLAADRGEVVAAPSWGAEPEILEVGPAESGSLEAYFRDHGPERFSVVFEDSSMPRRLRRGVPHWAVGVVWEGDEPVYVSSEIGDRYEAMIFIEETSALPAL